MDLEGKVIEHETRITLTENKIDNLSESIKILSKNIVDLTETVRNATNAPDKDKASKWDKSTWIMWSAVLMAMATLILDKVGL